MSGTVRYHLAIDIGASSGRHMIGYMQDGKMQLEEIYRFENGMSEKNGHLCWDYGHLRDEIIAGLKKCREADRIPETLAIDTWGVDFVLLDGDDRAVSDAVAYRDSRTAKAPERVYAKIPARELYSRTGIQYAVFNTIFQLEALLRDSPEIFDRAQTLLFVPDYLNFLLTGVKKCEYTIASTSSLLNAETRDWDRDIIRRMGLKESLFLPLSQPGDIVGTLKREIADEVGFDCRVVNAAEHDTASAVIAVPMEDAEHSVYISSGTWSLLGIERTEAELSVKSMELNFTNEGGYGKTYRYLANIMGLWMIQSVRRELVPDMGFGELCELAARQESYEGRVSVDDERFLAPASMCREIRDALEEKGYALPVNPGQYASCVYMSLAERYAEAVKGLEQMFGTFYDTVNIVGGGCNADYLNRLTARLTGKRVLAGPAEGTAIGNVTVQLIADGELKDVREARRTVRESFGVMTYEP